MLGSGAASAAAAQAFCSPPGPYDQRVRDDDAGRMLAVDDALVDQLEHGPLHRFAEYASLGGVIPAAAPVCTRSGTTPAGWCTTGSQAAIPGEGSS
jgi:hypothetical protein